MINKICLITPSHISANPRLIKEAQSLIKKGFDVTVVFTQNLDLLTKHDHQILSENPKLKFKVLNVSKSNSKTKLYRLFCTFFSKFLDLTAKFIPILNSSPSMVNRYYKWQLKQAKRIQADLYIAHNLGALPIAVQAAEANKAKSGFDAEDFHRNELVTGTNLQKELITQKLEDIYIPKVDYITAASPLIAREYENLYKRKVTSILNVFPKVKYPHSERTSEDLILFWFSQTIGPNRGLETIFGALNRLEKPFTFHLLGNCDDQYRNEILLKLKTSKQKSVIFHTSIAPNEIFERCKFFHIGFASEPGFSLNNNIALSNKIFTYIQCGLAVLASDTPAQAKLMVEYPEMGFVYEKGNEKQLADLISIYANDEKLRSRHQKNAFRYGQTLLNWEVEEQKFLAIIQTL